MATDRLINQTQGEDIIDQLHDIATNVGNITYGPQTSSDKVVSMTGYQEASTAGAISQGDTLNEAIGKLEKKADDNATAVADKIDKLTSATAGDIATITATGEIADSAVALETTLSDSSDAKVPTSKAIGTYVDGKGYAVGVNSSTANNLVAFNDANGKALKDSGIAVATSTTGLTDSDTSVPTSKNVKTYVDSTATGISRYLGTITAASGLSTTAKKGDFYVVKTAWSGVHAGDEIIAEKDNPTATIDGTNWSLLHNEADTDTKYTFATGDTNGTFKVTPSDTGTAQSVPIKGLGAAAYKGVADTVSTSANLVTSTAVNTKLGDYVPKSDLVEVVNNGAKNRFDDVGWMNAVTITHGTKSVSNGAITLTASDDDCYTDFQSQKYPADYRIPVTGGEIVVLSWEYSTEGSQTDDNVYIFPNGGVTGSVSTLATNESYVFTVPSGTTFLTIRMGVQKSGNSATWSNIMLTTKPQYNISPDYEPHALGNQILTPAMIQKVDEGAKNILEITLDKLKSWNNSAEYTWNGNSVTNNGVTYTLNSDGSISTSGSATANSNLILYNPSSNTTYSNQMVISGCPNGGNYDTKYAIYLANSQASTIVSTENSDGSNIPVNIAFKFIAILFRSGTSATGFTFKPMICTLADWNVSHKYVPYRPNLDFVYDAINVVEITSAITPATGYTITNQTHVWKQGGHVFGTIVITQDTGTFNSSNEVAYMNAYRPSRQWVGMGAFSETVWTVSSVGYAFVDSNSPGKILVEDTKNTNSVVKIQIDYMIN